jgi:hypothetical protein
MCVAACMLCMYIKKILCMHKVFWCVHVVHVHKKISCACTMCIGACMLCMYIQKFLVRAQCVLVRSCCACTYKKFLCMHNVYWCVNVVRVHRKILVHVHKKISCACTKCTDVCMLSMYIQKILVHAHMFSRKTLFWHVSDKTYYTPLWVGTGNIFNIIIWRAYWLQYIMISTLESYHHNQQCTTLSFVRVQMANTRACACKYNKKSSNIKTNNKSIQKKRKIITNLCK